MGKQNNKVEKRKRRAAYLRRKKTAVKAKATLTLHKTEHVPSP
jgi:hypothetical protein